MDTQQILKTDIIDLMGMQNLPEAQKQGILDKMMQTVMDRILDRLLEVMSAEQRQKFDQLVDGDPSPEQVDEFLRANVAEYDQVASEEILKFKQEMVDQAEAVRKEVEKVK